MPSNKNSHFLIQPLESFIQPLKLCQLGGVWNNFHEMRASTKHFNILTYQNKYWYINYWFFFLSEPQEGTLRWKYIIISCIGLNIGLILLSVSTVNRSYEFDWAQSLRIVSPTADSAPVSPFLQLVVTKPSQMISIPTEGSYVGHLRK